jgi:hypothetical protein
MHANDDASWRQMITCSTAMDHMFDNNVAFLFLSFWGLTVWLPQTSATQTPQQNAG